MGILVDFTVFGICVRLLLGLLIGFCIGLTGVGGGVLVLPSLTVILGLPASVAIGTSNLFAAITRLSATYHHLKLKTVDMQAAKAFLVGAVPASVVASLLISRYASKAADGSGDHGDYQAKLYYFVACTVLACGSLLFFNMLKSFWARKKKEVDGASRGLNLSPVARRWAALFAGLLTGTIVGMTSVGGGVLIIPLLIAVFGLSASRTVGTSLFIALPLTIVASASFAMGGHLDAWTAVLMAAGSLVGVPFGSRLSVKMPEKALQAVVISIILLSGLSMILKNGS